MPDQTKNAYTNDAEVIEILQLLTEWHSRHVSNLRQIVEAEGGKIELQGANGKTVELTGELRQGFVMGVQLALGWLGELPLKMEAE